MNEFTSLTVRLLALAALVFSNLPGRAATVAYWRFEEGPAGANVARNGQPDGTFYGAVADSSGNGNTLSAWSDGGGAGYAYRADVKASPIPGTGAANNFSVQNTGGYPAMWATNLQAWNPASFTFEVSYKPENGSYRTFIGRDSQGPYAGNVPDPNLAAMYFQLAPDNSLRFNFVDNDGNWQTVFTGAAAVSGFDFPNVPAAGIG